MYLYTDITRVSVPENNTILFPIVRNAVYPFLEKFGTVTTAGRLSSAFSISFSFFSLSPLENIITARLPRHEKFTRILTGGRRTIIVIKRFPGVPRNDHAHTDPGLDQCHMKGGIFFFFFLFSFLSCAYYNCLKTFLGQRVFLCNVIVTNLDADLYKSRRRPVKGHRYRFRRKRKKKRDINSDNNSVLIKIPTPGHYSSKSSEDADFFFFCSFSVMKRRLCINKIWYKVNNVCLLGFLPYYCIIFIRFFFLPVF